MSKRQASKSYLYFNVEGEWVTNTARSWLYEEARPYHKVLDFLLSAMEGSSYSKDELNAFANDILLGKRKLTGSTGDDTYGLVDDNTDIIVKYPLYFENRIEEKEQRIEEEPSSVRSFVEENKRLFSHEEVENYGWLSPEGKWFSVDWGHHSSWASEYTKNFKEDIVDAGDYLVEHGWLLFHNPSQGPVYFYDMLDNANKKQKEFIYDYLLKRDRLDEAFKIDFSYLT